MTNELTDVRCPCGTEFPAESYDAGFIAGSGMCQNCDAALPPKDICTCPSGDGSLVHPCPAHPAVEQAGGDERDLQGAQRERDGWGPLPIVQVPWNVFDRAVMWVEDRRRYGDDGTIVDDWKALKTIQRAALAQPSPAAVQLSGSRERRIYVAGPMTGYKDFNFPAFNAQAEKLRGLGYHVENPAEHGIVDGAEWQDYLRYDIGRLSTCEAIFLLPGWSKSKGAALEVHIAKALGMTFIHHADAEREQPSPAQSEQAEAERPEVVGSLYLGGWADQEELEDNDVELDMKVVERLQVDLASKGDGVHMPLMTVAQHERIVEARWNRAMDLLLDHVSRISEKFKAERGAALAEVERLRQFERICEGLPQDAIDGGWTVQGIRCYAKRLEDQLKVALARVAELEHVLRVVVNAADHGSWPTTVMHGIEKVREVLAGSAPPAKAQHSVPDGYRLVRLEHFAAIKAQLDPEQVDAYRGRNIYDEDKVYANWKKCRSALDEITDVFQQIDWDAENELAELLAAAPGKEVGHE
ncbi:TPA: DUF4406 domain-containing protein [Pseudomonas aeruginosa]